MKYVSDSTFSDCSCVGVCSLVHGVSLVYHLIKSLIFSYAQVHIWFSNFNAAIMADASGANGHDRSMKLYKEMKKGRKPSRTDTCECADQAGATSSCDCL